MTTATFEEIVANLHRRPLCDITTTRGRQCDHYASWRVVVHGCGLRIMCTQHKQRWEKSLSSFLDEFGCAPCVRCGQAFPTIDDMRQVKPL